MKFKTKLSVLFAVGIASAGVIVIFMIITMQRNIFLIYEQNLIYITLDDKIKHKTASAHLWFEELLAGDSTIAFETDVMSPLESARSIITGALRGEHTEIGDFQKTDDHRITYRLRDVETSLNLLKQIVETRYAQAQDSTKKSHTGSALDQEFDKIYYNVHESADNLTLYINDKIIENVETIKFRTTITIIVIGLIFCMLGIFVYRLEHRNEGYTRKRENKLAQETAHLDKLSDFVEKIAEGDFDVQFQGDKYDILVKKLDEMRQKLQASAQEDQQRTFVREGINQINNLLRNEFAKSENGYFEIINFIMTYSGLTQAGFFLVEDVGDAPYLELKACIAFDRQKFNKKQIPIHEGIIGQCVQEQKMIFLKDIPDDYLQIVSGLGETSPKNIIMIPLIYNMQVIGIIELASLYEIATHELEFLEHSAETIASAVAGYQATERMQSLLEKAQTQAEQLRAQEEEMRQNTEELSATQEEMRRREQEYLRQIKDLKAQLSENN